MKRTGGVGWDQCGGLAIDADGFVRFKIKDVKVEGFEPSGVGLRPDKHGKMGGISFAVEIENLLLLAILLSVAAIALIAWFVWCFNRE